MPIEVNWGDPAQSFVLLTVQPQTESVEFIEAADSVLMLMDAGSHPISIVVDFTALQRPPRNILGIFPEISKRFGHQNSSRYMVMVGVKHRAFTELFSRVLRRITYTDTVEAAQALVAEYHAALEGG